MADDPWKRLREKEKRKEQEEEEERKRRLNEKKKPGAVSSAGSEKLSTSDLEPSLQQIRVLIEQVDALYQQYFLGLEKRPPAEKRLQLERIVDQVTAAPKPTAPIRFQCQTVLTSFMTRKDKWDRQLRDLEAGKIKKVVKR